MNMILVGKTPFSSPKPKDCYQDYNKTPQNDPFGICYYHICWDCIIKIALGKLFYIPSKSKKYIQHTAWPHANWAVSVPPRHVAHKIICDLGALSTNGFLQTLLQISSIRVFDYTEFAACLSAWAVSDRSDKPLLAPGHRPALVSVFGGRDSGKKRSSGKAQH